MKDQQGGIMKIIKKFKYLFTILLFIILLIYISYIKMSLNKKDYHKDEIVSNVVIENNSEEEKINQYHIDIKGAIKNPGVYLVESSFTVNDVIQIAGGLTKDADTSLINLAKKVNDEMVIVIYTKDEVKNSNLVNTVIKVIEKECICPNIENDGCLNTDIKDTITNTDTNTLVNINTASIDELQTITGIGESKAQSIIKYREENGKFQTIEDIKNVEGIGEKLYETIKIYITT